MSQPRPGPQIAGVADPGEVAAYLRRRQGRGLGRLKAWGERRALRRCLAAAGPLGSLCDCPSGPGRLFPVWAETGARVLGVDASPAAVSAARTALRRCGAPGRVLELDLLRLPEALDAGVDLTACIRFLYYFDRPGRIERLRVLAEVSRLLLVQYRTSESVRARRNARRGRGLGKYALGRDEIRDELQEAGWRPMRFEALGPLSERLFVLAELS